MRHTRLSTALAALLAASPVWAVEVPILYLRQEVVPPPVLSNLDPVPEDLGIAGRRGRHEGCADHRPVPGPRVSAGHRFGPPGRRLAAEAATALAGHKLMLLDAPAEAQLAVTDLAAAQDALLFNVVRPRRACGRAECRANLLHTAPEDAARTDALMQVLQKKQWTDLVLITGPQPADQAFAATWSRRPPSSA
jgi:ABC transporter substrate binding protein (PQQ-dependent alcohol dehydrogenase system)